jgi:hypothetical protein
MGYLAQAHLLSLSARLGSTAAVISTFIGLAPMFANKQKFSENQNFQQR